MFGKLGKNFGSLGFTGKGTSTPSIYTGQLATGCVTLEDTLTFGATNQMTSRSRHIARSTITTLAIVVPTWYTVKATGLEHALGGTASVTASIEYPVGTFTQLKWGGVTPATIPDNANNQSDFVSVAIPNGAVFFVRLFWQSASGFLLNNANDIGIGQAQLFALDTTNGEAFNFAASGLTDQTMGGTITTRADNGVTGWRPAAIVGPTTQPALFLLGDSRMQGYHDFYNDGSTNVGHSKAYGPSFGYINTGVFALTTAQYISTHARKNELAAYCSHIIFELGENDVGNTGGALTAFLANQQTIFGYFPGKPIFAETIVPASTSTDAWLTSGNQTTSANNANRITYNTSLRAGSIAGLTGFFEFATIAEGTLNSGIWNPSSSPISGVYTGTQTTTVMNVTAVTSGAIALLDSVSGLTVGALNGVSTLGTGTGQTGTYNMLASLSASSGTLISNAPTVDGVHERPKMNGLYVTGGAFNPSLIFR